MAAGVSGSLPGIIGHKYRKLGNVLAPCQPVEKENVALPELAPALDTDCDQYK